MVAVETWHVHPVIKDDGLMFFILSDGSERTVLSFKGLYGDVRDCDVSRRIAALPDLVEAGRRAAKTIRTIHSVWQKTGSGNAVLARVASIGDRGKLFIEGLADLDASDGEALALVLDEADDIASELFEAVCEAANQIDYMIEKFDLAGVYDAVRAEIEAAVGKAEAATFRIDDPAEAEGFREWEASSREILEGKRKRFASC